MKSRIDLLAIAELIIGILFLITSGSMVEFLTATFIIGIAARTLYETSEKYIMINLESMTHEEINHLLLTDNLTMELRHDAIRELFRRAK